MLGGLDCGYNSGRGGHPADLPAGDRECLACFFVFNDAATTEIYTLSLHDALPISRAQAFRGQPARPAARLAHGGDAGEGDRKSTRLNSSHTVISYAVFCLKKK